MVFDTRKHARAATQFALAATSDEPHSVMALSEGMRDMANEAATGNNYNTFLGCLRSAVERQPGDWTVVPAAVVHVEDVAANGSGLFVGLCRQSQQPAAIMGSSSYYTGMRLFRFQTFTGQLNSCSLVPLVSEDEWGRRMAVAIDQYRQREFDETVESQLKLIVAAALAVLTERVGNTAERPSHVVRHLAELTRLVPSIDAIPSTLAGALDESGGLDRAMKLIAVTALAMGRRPSEIMALAEQRVASMLPDNPGDLG